MVITVSKRGPWGVFYQNRLTEPVEFMVISASKRGLMDLFYYNKLTEPVKNLWYG